MSKLNKLKAHFGQSSAVKIERGVEELFLKLKFKREVEIVKDPYSIIGRAANKSLTESDATLVSEVYPNVFNSIKEKIFTSNEYADLELEDKEYLISVFGEYNG